MKIKRLTENYLSKGTPYMLRNDGQLLDCPSYEFEDGDNIQKHPYLIGLSNIDSTSEFYRLLIESLLQKTLMWLYKNTGREETKRNIEILVFNMIRHKKLSTLVKPIDISWVNLNGQEKVISNDADLKSLFQVIEDELNQEFLRIRMSDMFYGGNNSDFYARVSSAGFNWFNLIWHLVYENRNNIGTVTVVTDPDSGKTDCEQFYSHNGVEFNHLPTKDFIEMPGNPIVESYENVYDERLSKGWSLTRCFNNTRPDRIHTYYSNRKSIEKQKREF